LRNADKVVVMNTMRFFHVVIYLSLRLSAGRQPSACTDHAAVTARCRRCSRRLGRVINQPI